MALTGVAVSTPAMAAVTLSSLFSDHMVAQREMEVPVWGTDTASQSITVKLGTQQATGTAGSDGKWTVRLPAQAAGGPFDMTVTGSSTVTVADVYVGEVWLGTGQSNMGYTMQCGYSGCAMKDAATEIAAANYPLIRTTNFSGRPSATPVSNTSTAKSTWLVVSPQTAPGISAIGYFFSRELFKNLNGVAIGLIHSSSGGSCLQCWMSKESIQAIPSVAADLASFEANPSYSNVHNPYICYNGQIAPLIPYAIRGVVWYQGESVTWGGDTYRDIQVGLISSWRKAWGQDFTFLITQLPNYNISSTGWPVLREAQLQASQILPNTGISVNIDIGDPNYVHPSDKEDQGQRLGMAARGLTYGQTDFAYYSPIYDHMAIEGSSIRLYFTHAETGLAFKGGTGTGFEIAGADGTYVTATAAIQPDATILVSAASVTAPKNARYCWAGNPTASLYNQGNPALPASPFRTDPPALPAGGPDGGVVGSTDGGAVVGPKDSGVVTGDAPSVGPKDSGVVTGDAPSVGPKDSGGMTTGGSGGNTGAGGITGSGGVTGSGGITRSGGNTAAGGNTTPSSNTAAGGSTGAGGIIASGGIIVSGGNTAPGSNASGGNTGADTAQATGATKESGCSCRLASHPSGLSDTAAFALGVLLVLGASRNRRRSRLDR
jgi:sialate O-acetylesterase